MEDDKARWRTDVAQYGLKHCALPSCDKREASVQQYKFCSACRSVWYCSAEHGALHWKEHKPICRATTAAQQAADDAGAVFFGRGLETQRVPRLSDAVRLAKTASPPLLPAASLLHVAKIAINNPPSPLSPAAAGCPTP